MKILRFRKSKVFVIGSNKTGTTSLKKVLSDFGFRVGDQRQAELLLEDWSRRDFSRIIKYCRSADAFQDIPFSLEFTYQAVDAAFPGSKFILSIRDSADQWYESLVRFHAKRRGLDRPPTANELRADNYIRPGWQWHASRLIYGVNERTVWDKELYKKFYINHIDMVCNYFRFRPDDLLTLNVADGDAMECLARFLGVTTSRRQMPHLNASK